MENGQPQMKRGFGMLTTAAAVVLGIVGFSTTASATPMVAGICTSLGCAGGTDVVVNDDGDGVITITAAIGLPGASAARRLPPARTTTRASSSTG